MINSASINQFSDSLSDIDKEYFKRRWATDIDIYMTRLKAINFVGKEKVLDAGFGVGQWLYCLASLNKNAYGIEYSKERHAVTKALMNHLKISNTNLIHGSIEKMPYEDGFFDAVFSYSVIYQTDFKKSLREIHRILKKGGELYFNTNDLGWYIYNLLEAGDGYHNFSSKQYALDSIESSLLYYSQNNYQPGSSIIMQEKYVTSYLNEIGFEIKSIGPDGSINPANVDKITSFYKKDYYGLTNVYEVLCVKKG